MLSNVSSLCHINDVPTSHYVMSAASVYFKTDLGYISRHCTVIMCNTLWYVCSYVSWCSCLLMTVMSTWFILKQRAWLYSFVKIIWAKFEHNNSLYKLLSFTKNRSRITCISEVVRLYNSCISYYDQIIFFILRDTASNFIITKLQLILSDYTVQRYLFSVISGTLY